MAASITVYGVKIGTRLAQIQADYAGTVQVLTGKLLADTLATLNDDSVGIMLDVTEYPASEPGSVVIKDGFDYLAERITKESQLFVTATGDKVFHVSMINFDQGSYAVNFPAIVSADKDSATYADVMAWPQADATGVANVALTGTAPLTVGGVNLGSGEGQKRVTLTAQTDPGEDGGYIYTVDAGDYTLTPVSRNAAAVFATGITNQTTGLAYQTVSDLITYLMNVIEAP